MPGVEIRG